MHTRYLLIALLLTAFNGVYAKVPAQKSLSKGYILAYEKYQEDPENIKSIIGLARAAYTIGEYKQSLDLVQVALKQNPSDPFALMLYGDLLVQQKKNKEAKEQYQTVISRYGSSSLGKKAEKNIAILDRMENPFQSKLYFQLSAGVDSNPIHAGNSDYLSTFFTTMACAAYGPECDYIESSSSDANPYVDLNVKKNYLNDIGKLGGFYATYGWELDVRNYLENIDAGHLTLMGGWGLGVVNRSGQYNFRMRAGRTFDKRTPYPGKNIGLDYELFEVNPSYTYHFKDKDRLTLGFYFQEQNANREFIYDPTPTIFGDESYTYYETEINKAYIKYETKLTDAKNPFSVKVYIGDRSNFNDYYDFNTTYYVPYRNYDLTGWELSYEMGFEKSSHLITLTLENKKFFDHYLQNQPVPFGYDYDNDPDEILRQDNTVDFTYEIRYTHKDKAKYQYGYNMYINDTNYAPMAFVKHRFYYTYLWLP